MNNTELRELEYHLGQQSVQCESLREKVSRGIFFLIKSQEQKICF